MALTRYRALAILAALVPTACDAMASWLVPGQEEPSAPRPIPSAASAPTGRPDRAAREAWGGRAMLAAYDRWGRHDARWDALARRAIEVSLPAVLESASRPPSPEERAAAGRAALAAGCDDPLVLFLLARAIQDQDPLSAEPEEFFRRSVEGMKTVPYARAIAREAASALFDLYARRIEGLGLRPPLAALELRWFEESLTDGSYGPKEDVVLVWQLSTGQGAEFAKRNPTAVATAVEGAPWVERWVKLYFSGLAHVRGAWEARGTGFAKDVKTEQWAVFHRENTLARRDYEESWKLRPDRPETCTRLMYLAQDDPQPGQSARLWFDRALAAQMDYLPAYEAMWERQLPRWGGSYEEMLALGKEALDTSRFDTAVPARLLEITHRIRQDQRSTDGAGGGGTPVFERPEVDTLLVRLFEGYLAEPSRASEKALWEAQWAVAADRAGRPAEALRHLAAAGFRLERPARRFVVRENETPRDFAARLVVAGSPAAAEVAEGARLRGAFDVEGALAAYRAAARKDASPQLAQAIGGPVASLEIERRLADGGWVPFLPRGADLDGWRDELGTWRLDPDGSLVGRAGSRGLLLVSDARVGANFEVRGTVELVSSTNGSFQGGVAFGRPTWTAKEWIAFRVKRNTREGRVAYFSCHFEAPLDEAVPIAADDSIAFTVRVQDGRLYATVAGRPVVAGLEPARGLVRDRDLRVGLGGYVDENVVELRFRDVAVRRLAAAAPGR